MKNNMVKVVMVVENGEMVAEINVSKAFNKRASKYGTEEYTLLRNIMKSNAEYSPRIVEVKNENKKTYKRLTLAKMEEYILTQENAEENLKKFEAVQKVAKAKNSLYPLTKKWFLDTFKNYKESEVSENETTELMKVSDNKVVAVKPAV